MSEIKDIVVIGGGIVGCSLLYALARKGCCNTILIEKNELTSGSTWHAAGNVTHFGHYAEITKLYADSLDLYREAEQVTQTDIGFHNTGSLRLANNKREWDAYLNLEKFYRDIGVPYRVVGPNEIKELNPLVDIEGVLGAAYTPGDGHVDPTLTTNALAAAAKNLGAEIIKHQPVTSIEQTNGEGWVVSFDGGEVLAKEVVLATSFWTRELTIPLGLDLPLYAFEHHEVITEDIDELKTLNREVPAVRDSRAPSNVRQERLSLLCGVYETNPKLWATDGIPKDFGQELLVPDLERLEDHLLKVIERMPVFGNYGIKTVNNGPLCFPPDGCPMVGPIESHKGLWLAAGFPVGIGTGGGSAQFLAEWMIEGKPPYSLDMIYPSRFNKGIPKQQVFEQMKETYSSGYKISE